MNKIVLIVLITITIFFQASCAKEKFTTPLILSCEKEAWLPYKKGEQYRFYHDPAGHIDIYVVDSIIQRHNKDVILINNIEHEVLLEYNEIRFSHFSNPQQTTILKLERIDMKTELFTVVVNKIASKIHLTNGIPDIEAELEYEGYSNVYSTIPYCSACDDYPEHKWEAKFARNIGLIEFNIPYLSWDGNYFSNDIYTLEH